MANRLICILSLLLLAACHGDPDAQRPALEAPFSYPASKFWAHRVNTVAEGREKAPLFDGLETDINYSAFQDQLFIAHGLDDTLSGLTFEAWLDSLPQPVSNCLWLDAKNLSTANAPAIAHHVLNAARRHGIVDRVMVESWDCYALRIVKDSGLHVILWTDNPSHSGVSEEAFKANTQKQIDLLHPDALSGDSLNFPRLPNAFPGQNIHIWDTPRPCNDSNIAHSQMIASHPAVKVVLVDWPKIP